MPLWTWWTIAGVLLASGGLVAAWGLFGDRSRKRRCLRCGYDMGAVQGLRCPECGREARGEAGLVGTRRRRSVAVGGAALMVAGGAAFAHAVVSRNSGGWWRFAPTAVLLHVIDIPSANIARDAIDRRIHSETLAKLRGRVEAMSPAQWEQLAIRCEKIILSDRHSDRTRSWAVVVLTSKVPIAAASDPSIERLLRDGDCVTRGWISIGILTGDYQDYFGSMSEVWADEFVRFVTESACPPQALVAATGIARLDPLPCTMIRAIAAGLSRQEGVDEVWRGLTLGLARGKAPEAVRAAMLAEIAARGDPAVQALAADALAEMATYGRDP